MSLGGVESQAGRHRCRSRGPPQAEAAAAYYGVSEGWGSKLIAPARAYPHACWRRSVRLVADQPLERGLLADRVQVGVVLRGTAKLLRHLDGVPEVIERVTRPAQRLSQ